METKVQEVTRRLMETDALTGTSDLTSSFFIVEAENVEYLVATIMHLQAEYEVQTYYKTKEVARILAVSDVRVRQLIHEGKLKASKISPLGNTWRISESELKRFINLKYGDDKNE